MSENRKWDLEKEVQEVRGDQRDNVGREEGRRHSLTVPFSSFSPMRTSAFPVSAPVCMLMSM